jgi:hypothetical protein
MLDPFCLFLVGLRSWVTVLHRSCKKNFIFFIRWIYGDQCTITTYNNNTTFKISNKYPPNYQTSTPKYSEMSGEKSHQICVGFDQLPEIICHHSKIYTKPQETELIQFKKNLLAQGCCKFCGGSLKMNDYCIENFGRDKYEDTAGNLITEVEYMCGLCECGAMTYFERILGFGDTIFWYTVGPTNQADNIHAGNGTPRHIKPFKDIAYNQDGTIKTEFIYKK